MMFSSRRRQSDRGFTLTEGILVTLILLTLAAMAVPLLNSQKSRSKTPGTQQAVLEASIAVKSFQQSNAGALPTTITAVKNAGYAPQPNVVLSVCTNWSNGAAATGKYMVRAYATTKAGAQDTNAKQYLYDSAKDSSPREATQAEVDSKFCTSGSVYFLPA